MASAASKISYAASPAARARFSRICRDVMREAPHTADGGIGTLGEKRMHIILKRYLTSDADLHEVGVRDTRYVSDVRIGNDIYEVQTGAFYPMRKKIAHYLEKTDCTVTVVHPIIVDKWVTWVDPETGELTPRKKSPKHASPISLLPQLYSLLPYLGDRRLRFRLLMITAEDFRLLNGWSRDRKKGSDRYERIPLELLGELEFSTPEDFATLIPQDLPSPFTVKDFMRHSRLRSRDAYSAVHVLEGLGRITPTDPIGRAMAFAVN